MKYESLYDLDQFVYLRHDPDQIKRQVIEVIFTSSGGTIYMLVSGDVINKAYESEISEVKDYGLS